MNEWEKEDRKKCHIVTIYLRDREIRDCYHFDVNYFYDHDDDDDHNVSFTHGLFMAMIRIENKNLWNTIENAQKRIIS